MLKPYPAYEPARIAPNRAFGGYRPAESHAFFYDDFNGDDLGNEWDITLFNLGTAEIAQGVSGGVAQVALTAANQFQFGGLHMSNNLQFDLNRHLLIEYRARFTVLPGSGVIAFLGLADGVDVTPDQLDVSVWFRWEDAAPVARMETDDDTTPIDDVLTSQSAVVDEWHTYTIDFFDLTDVRFLIDGVLVNGTQTFDMSAVSSGLLEPFIAILKPSETVVGTLEVDYFKAWQERET